MSFVKIPLIFDLLRGSEEGLAQFFKLCFSCHCLMWCINQNARFFFFSSRIICHIHEHGNVAQKTECHSIHKYIANTILNLSISKKLALG